MKTLDSICKSIAAHTPKPTEPVPATGEKLANANNLSEDFVNQIAERVVDILSSKTADTKDETSGNEDTKNEPATNESESDNANNADETDEDV